MKRILKMLRNDNIIIKSMVEIIVPVLLLVVLLSVIFYNNTMKSVDEQILKSNASDLKSVSDVHEKTFESVESIINFIYSDKKTKLFFLSENPYYAEQEYKLGMGEKIKSVDNLYDYISSIYLYVENENGEFFLQSQSGGLWTENAPDSIWLQKVREGKRAPSMYVYPRSFNRYPFLLTFDKEFTEGENRCIISVNIDLWELNNFIFSENSERFYILLDDRIVYNRYMTKMFENVSGHEIFGKLQSDSYDISQFVENGGKQYAVSMMKSKRYDWNYAVINPVDVLSTQSASRRLIVIVVILILFILGGFIVIRYVLGIYYPIKQIENLIEGGTVSEEKKTSAEIRRISDKIMNFANFNEELKKELDQKLYNMKKWQISALNAQINPHFMFNVLNTIYMQSISDFKNDKKTSVMLLKISKYLRYILENEEETASVETEIYYNKIYVDFLMERYDELKNVSWDIPEGIGKYRVLKLCLQPVLENAVYHGITYKKDGGGVINVRAYEDGDMLIVSVTDNGIGMDKEKLDEIRSFEAKELMNSEHIGLYNINKRLNLLYGEKYGIEIESKYNVGTTVKIKFPKMT